MKSALRQMIFDRNESQKEPDRDYRRENENRNYRDSRDYRDSDRYGDRYRNEELWNRERDYDREPRRMRGREGREDRERGEYGREYDDDDDYFFKMKGKFGKETQREEPKKIDKERAEKIAAKMKNEDGTHGAHWDFAQTKQVLESNGYQCDPAEFYLAMNMMYSDYFSVANRFGVNTVDFYSAMAKAFLDDKDAGEMKIEKYFEYVVK